MFHGIRKGLTHLLALLLVLGMAFGVVLAESGTALANSTYQTGNSCYWANGTRADVSISWELNGNYNRPVGVSASSPFVVFGHIAADYYQGSYNFANYGQSYYPLGAHQASFTISGATWAYWPNHDNYMIVILENLAGNNTCTVKVTDGR